MQYNTTRAMQRGRGVIATVLLALALGGGLICGLYWWTKRPALTAAGPTAAGATAPDTAGTGLDSPVARADAALQEKRMFVPPGDNAFELYLQVVDAHPGHAAARSALDDLFPYAVLYIEERIAEGDAADATRMLGLMLRANPEAPALPRLTEALDTLRSRSSAEEDARQMEEARIRALPKTAMQPAASVPAIDAPTVQGRVPDPSRLLSAPPATQPPVNVVEKISPLASTSPMASAPGTPVATTDTLPQVVSSAPARYPPIAMRRKLEGQVELEFTVLPSGQVDDVHVLSSEPAGIFDRAAVAAMERWQFAPQQMAVRGRRVFDFKLN